MKRREVLTLIAGATVWPLAARAQQGERMRRIGVLTAYVEMDSEAQRRVGAFREKIEQLGWKRGRNVEIDYRWSMADPARIRANAAELAALKSDVILASGEAAVRAAQQASAATPVVFVQIDDPVGAGIVRSLARPGENITGFTPFEFAISGKWLEVLTEVAPSVRQVMIMVNPNSAMHVGTRRVIEAAAPSFAVQATAAAVLTAADIERAIDAFSGKPNRGLIVLSHTLANVNRKLIIERAARQRLPVVYPFRHYVVDGGLISYGSNPVDQFRDAASYVDRILRGEKAVDLPVQAPTKFELVINLKTAKALGLDVPTTLLARADEVIE